MCSEYFFGSRFLLSKIVITFAVNCLILSIHFFDNLDIFKEHRGNYIITDPEGLPGRYLAGVLSKEAPLPELTLFHCAGTEEDHDAEALNLEATRQLFGSFGAEVPSRVVYVSSSQVYSPDAGTGVDETRPAFAWSEAGRSKARTEVFLEKWCAAHDAVLTIVRPALMFGKGVDGAMLRLFNRVARGRYVHIRGNDARLSVVTALDVATAMVRLAGHPGIYNVSDGRERTWLQLAEAMSANAGAEKRMTHLPAKWADVIYRFFRWVPVVEETLSPAVLEPFTRTLVLDNSRVCRETGIEFYDTLEVMARRAKDYPYEDS